MNEITQVFVFSRQAPFGQDVDSLFHPESVRDALGWETDVDLAIQRVQKIHPSMVIVANQRAVADCEPTLARLQTECPGVQIVEINLESWKGQIDGEEDPIVKELRDLLQTINHLYSKDGKQSPLN